MIRTLFVALTLLATCATADAALPWKTVAELEKDITNSQTGLCGPDQFLVKMQTVKDGVIYIILAAGDTRRFVIAELGDDNLPKTLYIGRVTQDGKLEISLQRAFIPGESPCPILFPTQVKG